MTLDELKAELMALCAKIDTPLAEEICKDNITPQMWDVVAWLPRDKSALPERGHHVVLEVHAYVKVMPVRYEYEAEPQPGEAPA